MKKLNELYDTNSDVLIKGIKTNSKEVEPGDIFVCTMGVTVDRHDFIDSAIESGASAIVVSKDVKEKSVPIIKVENTNLELPKLSAKFYDYPEKELTVIGVTGTNGKTSVAKLMQDLVGESAAYIGTIGAVHNGKIEKLVNTTPDSNILFRLFREFADAGCKYVIMETSSEAFFRNRLDYFTFDAGILTNVTSDHLNVHKTLENYVSCKKELFKKVKNDGFIVLNKEDNYYDEFSTLHDNLYTYSLKEKLDFYIKDYNLGEYNTTGIIVYENIEYPFDVSLLGEYNLYNLSAAFLTLLKVGFDIKYLLSNMDKIGGVPGRGEQLTFGQNYKIILDYAHTPDALLKILEYLNKIKKNKIITVFGSAGGREVEKRGPMGKIILDNSDLFIVTMDDPRFEDVNNINKDLLSLSDKTNYEIIINRKDAINHALSIARKDDIVLIAGKGTDNYMAIEDRYEEYSDFEVIKSYFN